MSPEEIEPAARYKLMDGSQSGHCCFEVTVVDTTKPTMINGEHWKNEYYPLCECFEEAEGEQIVQALNNQSTEIKTLRKQVADLQEALDNLAPYGKVEDDD